MFSILQWFLSLFEDKYYIEPNCIDDYYSMRGLSIEALRELNKKGNK